MSKPKRNFLPKAKSSHSPAEATMLAIRSAIDQKGYFVIVSGTSERHVQGLVDKIALRLKQELGEEPISTTGYEQAEWVLLDYGDVVVHVFYEPVRTQAQNGYGARGSPPALGVSRRRCGSSSGSHWGTRAIPMRYEAISAAFLLISPIPDLPVSAPESSLPPSRLLRKY
jgi:ribosome-associated protein